MSQKIKKSKDPTMRLIYTNEILKMLDNPDHYMELHGDITDNDVENLITYLQEIKISVPKIPDNDMREDIIKAMSRAWQAIELLNLMCALNGSREDE